MPAPAAYDPAARRQQVMDRMTEARRQNVSWEAIHTSLNNRVMAARKAGVSDLAIQQSLGFTNPDELIAATRTNAEQHLQATKPTGWVESFWNGLTRSSTAAIFGTKPVETQPQERSSQIVGGIGEMLGDVPAMVVGAVGGGAVGAAAGPAGSYVGAAAGANAAPQLIKSERDLYLRALERGEIKGPEDFLNAQAMALKETGEAGLVGAVAGAVGSKVAPLLQKMGASKLAQYVGTFGAEGATMITAQSALAGQMPRTEDFIDAAITIGVFHTAHRAGAATYRSIRSRLQQHYVDTGELPQAAAERATSDPVFRAQMLGRPNPPVRAGSSRTRTIKQADDTDEYIPDWHEREAAYEDALRREGMPEGFMPEEPVGPAKDLPTVADKDARLLQRNPHARIPGEGDKKWEKAISDYNKKKITAAEFRKAGEEYLAYRQAQSGVRTEQHNVPHDVYIVPRIAGGFDKAIPWILQHEGGLTTDTGGLTKWGISAKAHPGVNIAGLSKEDAMEIYHREYWRGIDADTLPPNMRLAAFDSAVNQGVGQTKAWLREANGDLNKFMQLRVEKYARLVRDPSGKWDQYAKSWANRIRDLGGSETMAQIVHNGPENTGREFSPQERSILALSEEGEGGGGGRKPPTGEPPPEEPDADPWKHVMGRVADHEGTDWLGNTIQGFERIYGELFSQDHPIRKMVDGVTKGEPLDDYHNPELLFRVAEGSSTAAQWAIEKQMIDLEGNVTGPALTDIIHGKSAGSEFSKADVHRFLDGYALAKWALMMEEQGKKTGIDIDKAKQVVAEGSAKYEKSFQHLVDWRNQTLRWLGDGGVHGKEKVDKLIAENGSTIPGYRRMDDGSYRPVNTSKPGIWNPIKTAKGSERLIEPILKSLMQDAYLRHQLAENNRAMVALADLGITGNKASQKRAVDFNVVSAIEMLKEEGIDEDMLAGLARSAGSVIPKDQVPIFRDGKLYGVKFEDPELTRVLRGYDQSARSTVMKVIATITSVPRNFQTRWNPLFPIRNLFYDMLQQAVTNPDAIRPMFGFFDGLKHMTTDPKKFEEWARSGGAEHVFTSISKDDFMKRVIQGTEEQSLASNAWNAVKSPFDALTAWTRMVSQPTRFSRFVQGQKKGETPLRAAVASAETATPRMAYGGPVGRAWNSIAPYTLAYLNGLEKSFRAMLGIGRTTTGVKYNAAATFAKGAAIITVPMIAQWYANKDEEWYKAMPDWQKDNAWFIVPPIGDMPPIPVAAPPLISTVFVAAPRRIMEAFIADNPHAAEDIWKTLGASLMPPGWVTGASILTPIIEHYSNFSFFRGRPLVNPDMIRGVQPAEQFTQYSSPAAKELAQFASDLPLTHSNFGWSPAVIDNYISQWGGPMGKTAANMAAAVLERPTNPPVEQKVSDWPGISSWTVRYPSASAEPIQQFYDQMTKLDQMYGSLRKLIRESDFEGFKRVVDRGGASAAAWQKLSLGENVPPNVDVSPYFDYLTQKASGADYENIALAHQAAKGLKNARDYSWSVYEDPNKTGHDKRQILDMTNAQMQVMAERGNEALDRALIGVKKRGAAAKVPVPDSIYFEQPAEP